MSETTQTRLLIIGPPGAGKGTQAARIAERYDVPAISTGDIFRANIQGGTELGQQVQAIIKAGELVPDSLTNEIVHKMNSLTTTPILQHCKALLSDVSRLPGIGRKQIDTAINSQWRYRAALPNPLAHIDPVTLDYYSEDYAFCERWRALGGECWVDPGLILEHWGTLCLTGDPMAHLLTPEGA